MTTEHSVLAQLVETMRSGAVRVVDLTQPLGVDTPVIELPEMFAPSPPFTLQRISEYDDKGPAWYWNSISMGEHTGTHFDAPVHWITGKERASNATDTIPVGQFVGSANVIDVSEDCNADPDFLLTVERVRSWEDQHGRIQPGSWLLMRSDWSKRQGREAFLNIREDGPHSPGPDPSCVTFLAEERDVLGFGTETVGTDAGQASNFDPAFPSHHIMHGAGKFGLASLHGLDQLPPTGSVVIAAPLKIVNGSGSPLRVLGLVPGT